MCLESTTCKEKWFLDSGYSRHMTGKANLFTHFEMKKGGKVTFGNNAKGKIVGIGQVGKKDSTYIKNVLLVDGLKHNLLSVSQLCDKGNRVTFKPKECFVSHMEENKVIFKGERVNNVYTIDLSSLTNQGVECFVAIKDDY